MNIQVYKKSNPVLFDRAIQDMQAMFEHNFAWLTYVFGRAHKLVKTFDGKNYEYPAVFIGNNEYHSVLPDDLKGNFLFFEVDDPQDFISLGPGIIKSSLSISFAIVIWYALNTVYNTPNLHMGEDVKNDILQALNKPGVFSNGHLRIVRVYEKPENIFRGYSLKQIDNQYLMFPYNGLRIECEFKIREVC